jgi:hypothetical protein
MCIKIKLLIQYTVYFFKKASTFVIYIPNQLGSTFRTKKGIQPIINSITKLTKTIPLNHFFLILFKNNTKRIYEEDITGNIYLPCRANVG